MSRNGSGDSRVSDIHLILAPLTLLIVVAILAAIGGYFFLTASTPEVVLPDETGKKYEEAALDFRKLGLLIEIIPEHGPDTAIGTVLRMQPAPGSRVKPGRPIILYVASGEAMVAVPDLVGTYFIEADNKLKRAGLDKGLGGLFLGAKASELSDSPAGTIISQSPLPGQMIKVGSTIDIVIAISKGADTMPNVVNMLLPKAMEVMASKGYSIEDVENFFTTSKPANTIISQKPSPGTRLGPETKVKVTVATPAVSGEENPAPAATDPEPGVEATPVFPEEQGARERVPEKHKSPSTPSLMTAPASDLENSKIIGPDHPRVR